MKNKIKLFIAVVFCAFIFINTESEAKHLDEIISYAITANVNEDATVSLRYDIEWKVLDSSSEGPLEWVKVGLPNSHYINYSPLTDTISSMSIKTGGETYARIDLDKRYYKDEIVRFSFMVDQDYLYEMNKYEEGKTVYTFTPGWFDEIDVDAFVVRWGCDKVDSFEPACLVDNGYLTWTGTMYAGDKETFEITYLNDAFNFDVSKSTEWEAPSSGSSSSGFESFMEAVMGIICLLFGVAIVFGPVVLVSLAANKFRQGSGFGTTKKITRTKIVYYPTCQGCGAAREEGKTQCEYCGRSFIKSEEVITEDELKNAEKEAGKFSKNGEFRYSSSPDTYVRVHVVNVPRPRPSCAHSSCAHSSCACAHSCACACACACAGGGRAGCTNKDFYNTNLKLKQLELKKEHRA